MQQPVANAAQSGGALCVCADNRRAILRRKIRRDLARDHARLFVPGPERAAERIDHAPFHLVNDVLGKIFEIERTGVFGELMSE